MINDTNMNEQYFETCINMEQEKLEKYRKLTNTVLSEKGENDRGVKNGYLFQFNSLISQVCLMYSAGSRIPLIGNLFPEIISVIEKIEVLENRYVEVIWLLSIGYLLNKKESFEKLVAILEKRGINDYLIRFLVLSYLSNHDLKRNDNFIHKKPYENLRQVIESKEPIIPLKRYLEKQWYIGHSDMGWYDTHKTDNHTYMGYWSFEAGAIVKALNIDDSLIINTPYYPYDLVHYHTPY